MHISSNISNISSSKQKLISDINSSYLYLIDVVLVVADDEAAWQKLMKEYKVVSTNGSTSWLGEADHPAKRTQWTGKPVCKVIVSHDRRTIAFYQLENIEQYEALLDYQLNALASQQNNKTKKRNNK